MENNENDFKAKACLLWIIISIICSFISKNIIIISIAFGQFFLVLGLISRELPFVFIGILIIICAVIPLFLNEKITQVFFEIGIPSLFLLITFILGFYNIFVSRYITNRRKKRCSLMIYAKYEKYRNDGGLYTPIYVYNYNGKNYEYYDENDEILSKDELPEEGAQIAIYINPNKPEETYIDGIINFCKETDLMGIIFMVSSVVIAYLWLNK